MTGANQTVPRFLRVFVAGRPSLLRLHSHSHHWLRLPVRFLPSAECSASRDLTALAIMHDLELRLLQHSLAGIVAGASPLGCADELRGREGSGAGNTVRLRSVRAAGLLRTAGPRMGSLSSHNQPWS